MHVLLDTNSVLDALFDREPWSANARAIWQAHEAGSLVGWATASSLTDIFYIGRRIKDRTVAREAVRLCLATFEICRVDRDLLLQADQMSGLDFEDNVQIACAVAEGLDAIVTRDPRGFVESPIAVLSPEELVRRLGLYSRPAPEGAQSETVTDEGAPEGH